MKKEIYYKLLTDHSQNKYKFLFIELVKNIYKKETIDLSDFGIEGIDESDCIIWQDDFGIKNELPNDYIEKYKEYFFIEKDFYEAQYNMIMEHKTKLENLKNVGDITFEDLFKNKFELQFQNFVDFSYVPGESYKIILTDIKTVIDAVNELKDDINN